VNYYALETMPLHDEDLCFLQKLPTEIEATEFKIAMGIPIADEYPDDVRMYMDDEYPGLKLPDLVGNTQSFLIVSERVKEVIERLNTAPTEYLRLSIYNHKKRLHSAAYWFINPLGGFDCLNLGASDIEWLGPDVVDVNELVLDPAKVREAPALFRVQEDPYTYVMNEELGRALAALDATNIYLDELRQA
jgi:hypothetical protein